MYPDFPRSNKLYACGTPTSRAAHGASFTESRSMMWENCRDEIHEDICEQCTK